MSRRSNTDLGLLALRSGTGIVFIAHGSQKLFGWFGGHGLSAEAIKMAERGLEPADFMVLMAGLSEFVGGLLVLFGLFTSLGALAIAVVMSVAIAVQTGQNGFFIQDDGFEHNLVLMSIAAALGLAGAGAYSLDRALISARPRLTRLLRQPPTTRSAS